MPYKGPIPDGNLSWYINLIVLVAVLPTLAKIVVILKLGLRNVSKDNKPYIFRHLLFTTTCFEVYNYLSSKIIDKANSKFNLSFTH